MDGITTAELDGMLEKINDPVTRNGVRKRCVTLFRWCKKQKWLPEADIPAIEKTIIVRETAKRIGIISSEVFEKCLRHIRASQPEDLAALVFAGFCGLRGDEIHGKRHQGQKIRQVWEDIHIGQKILNVTNVKQNTPSWRLVPICDAAVAWLKLCPDFIKTQKAAGPAQNTGQPGTPVCGPNAMQSIRRSCALAKISLPRNCFRHSFISHRIAQLNGNKNQTADEAGNSVRQITKHYRVPLPKEQGDTWFNLFP